MSRSAEINEIALALSKAQGAIKSPEKNKTVVVKTTNGSSYTFDYADLGAITDAIKGPLSANGLAFTHLIETDEDGAFLSTYLIHSSGQWLGTKYPLPSSADAKVLGGALTYGKRYSLSALIGVCADDDADAEPENVTEFRDKKRPGGPVANPVGPILPNSVPGNSSKTCSVCASPLILSSNKSSFYCPNYKDLTKGAHTRMPA